MRRLLLALAVLATLGLAAAPVTAVEPDEVLDDPVLEARARDLSRILRCPVCQNESIDSSSADLARDLRILVRERLVAGDSDQQVLDFLVASYGDYILLQPPLKPRTYLLWFGPVLVLLLIVGRDSEFVDVAWFFSTAAVLTFGGAYSVLAYISQEAVNTFGWLEPGEMVSGLGMAETTPGPLIQVVQFVGFMGPYRDPGPLTPIQAGVFGAVIATWVTFIPSFLWIFLGAPFIEHLRGRPSLTSALSAVTAAVVGVVLNLAIWFALFTLFDTVEVRRGLGAVVYQPDLASLDWAAVAIASFAGVAIFRLETPIVQVVAAAAALGVAHQLFLA